MSHTRIIEAEPLDQSPDTDMEFRLTYDGELLGTHAQQTRTKHKHEIRRHFHRQLKRLWNVVPQLQHARAVDGEGRAIVPFRARWEWLATQFQRAPYQFVPLVTTDLSLLCGISILLLRPDLPGSLIRSGDIDNRLKTVFDALRMPTQTAEFGGYDQPSEDEKPFFCLLEDDRLISRVSIETDILLQDLGKELQPNDVRLVISVSLRPTIMTWQNGIFA
jgi:hypothetical protein